MIKKHLDLLTTEAQKYYTSGGCSYHNWEHVSNVLTNSSLLASSEFPSDTSEAMHMTDLTYESIHIAALWHDAIYIPGAKNGVNEQASAAALNSTWVKNNIPNTDKTLTDAMELIEYTAVSYHLNTYNFKGNLPFQILLDADLSGLASDYNVFQQNQANIILENHGDPFSVEDNIKCGDFLEQFLLIRPFIYHTKTARDWYEYKARANIIKYVAQYRKFTISSIYTSPYLAL